MARRRRPLHGESLAPLTKTCHGRISLGTRESRSAVSTAVGRGGGGVIIVGAESSLLSSPLPSSLPLLSLPPSPPPILPLPPSTPRIRHFCIQRERLLGARGHQYSKNRYLLTTVPPGEGGSDNATDNVINVGSSPSYIGWQVCFMLFFFSLFDFF